MMARIHNTPLKGDAMFTIVFSQMIKMFLIMVLAFILYRMKIVRQEGNRTISDLLLLVVNPCVIINVFQRDMDPVLVRGLVITFFGAAAAHLIGIGIARLVIPKKADRAGWMLDRFSSIYGNCAFVGIPLIYSVVGSTGVFYLSAYLTVFNLFSWTHGLGLLTGSFSPGKLKEGITSPIVLSTLFSILLFFLQIKIPSLLLDTINYIGDMNTPFAMLVAGFSVAQANLGEIFRRVAIYRVILVKHLLMPAGVLALLFFIRLSPEIAYTLLIASACPAAATCTMMSIRYGQDYKYASEIFAVSTLWSVVTIPLFVLLAEHILPM